jgi:DNA invertase Pin-like site-specific DNA recombinase
MVPFAAYLRTSTDDHQSPSDSAAWQLRLARQLIEPAGGEIVATYHDVDQSRSVPWERRPEAARLLDAIRNASRSWADLVIAEPQRAFAGNQFGLVYPVLVHYGVSLWVPEVGGRVDPDSEAHDLLMSLFGGLAKAERNRIRHRVRAAMAAHASSGRWLGGRPPYGYTLVDAGPHPNPEKAASGARLHQLAPDSIAEPVVRRIFDLYANDGLGFKAIARILTAEAVPSPSAHDPARNPHRPGHAWASSAVRAILSNLRYLGRHVFGRQRRHELLIDPAQPALGHADRMRWRDAASWVTAEDPTHPPLVDEDTWHRAQTAMHNRGREAGGGSPRSAPGRYALVGILACQHGGRRMQGSHTRGHPLYRCRLASIDYATTPDGHPDDPSHPRGPHPRRPR